MIHFRTIIILAEFVAPQTTRNVSLEKTQIPMMSSVQRKTDRDFGKFRCQLTIGNTQP